MADSINKSYFDYIRDCGCDGTETDTPDVVPCSDQAEDVNFNNIGTNYQSTDVRSALIEIDNKRVINGSDILARVQKTGDSMSGDLVFENPITSEIGAISPQLDSLDIRANALVKLDSPNFGVSGYSSLVGYTLTVGQGGLIVPVLTTVPELSWNDVNNVAVPLQNQSYTDLGVSVTTTEIIDKWDYKAVITGTASVGLNLTFQLKADGVAIATTQASAVLSGTNGTSVSFSDVSTYASGTVFTIEAQIDEASGTYSVDFIDFTINKLSALAGTVWGSVTGTISDQSDLQNELNLKADQSSLTTLTNRVSANELDVLALQSPESTIYQNMVGNEPAYVEGQIYYIDGVHKFNGKYADTTMSLGREQWVDVVNGNGTDILNGQVIRYNHVAGGEPAVVLAIADNFYSASGIGVATHDITIANGGVVTTFGIVKGIDLSAFADGDILYLSDTVAGGLTTTPNDIKTRIGIVFNNDSINGELFVNPFPNLDLPTIYGNLGDGSAGATIVADTYQTVTNYAVTSNSVMDINPATGAISVPISGEYRITANLVLEFDSIGGGKEDIFLRLHATDNSQDLEIRDFLLKDAESGSFYPSISFQGVAGKDYQIQIKCSDTLTNVVYHLASFNITSVDI